MCLDGPLTCGSWYLMVCLVEELSCDATFKNIQLDATLVFLKAKLRDVASLSYSCVTNKTCVWMALRLVVCGACGFVWLRSCPVMLSLKLFYWMLHLFL